MPFDPKSAKKAGLKAVDLDENEPWAHHAVAHVHETLKEPRIGIKWMNNFSEKWKACNSFMYTHNWWHIALFYLKLKDNEKVLTIFDEHIWASTFGNKDFSQDQAGAISMLIRLKLLGVDIKSRWNDVTKKILKHLSGYVRPLRFLVV